MTALLWFTGGAAAGVSGYYGIDRIRFLWGSSVREMRHAGWRARKRRP
ncbi:hypothetical protein [Actinoallomurus sp. NPDC052274]